MFGFLFPDLNILQTDQMGRIVNELDTIQFSIKKASQLVKEIGRQVCILSESILNRVLFISHLQTKPQTFSRWLQTNA